MGLKVARQGNTHSPHPNHCNMKFNIKCSGLFQHQHQHIFLFSIENSNSDIDCVFIFVYFTFSTYNRKYDILLFEKRK